MTTQEFLAKEAASHWTLTDKTFFSAEMSTLQGNGLLAGGMVTGPTGKSISFKGNFKAEFDQDNDITRWVYTAGGFTYAIYND